VFRDRFAPVPGALHSFLLLWRTHLVHEIKSIRSVIKCFIFIPPEAFSPELPLPADMSQVQLLRNKGTGREKDIGREGLVNCLFFRQFATKTEGGPRITGGGSVRDRFIADAGARHVTRWNVVPVESLHERDVLSSWTSQRERSKRRRASAEKAALQAEESSPAETKSFRWRSRSESQVWRASEFDRDRTSSGSQSPKRDAGEHWVVLHDSTMSCDVKRLLAEPRLRRISEVAVRRKTRD